MTDIIAQVHQTLFTDIERWKTGILLRIRRREPSMDLETTNSNLRRKNPLFAPFVDQFGILIHSFLHGYSGLLIQVLVNLCDLYWRFISNLDALGLNKKMMTLDMFRREETSF